MKRALWMMVVLSVFLLALAPASLAAPARSGWNNLGIHTVQPGETLFCIGRAYGVDPWAIATQNGILNVNLIYPGVKLNIPDAWLQLPAGPTCARQASVVLPTPPTPTPTPPPCGNCTCKANHLVKTGDTLTALATLYKVNMWDIARCNCIQNLNYIRIGDTLCIP